MLLEFRPPTTTIASTRPSSRSVAALMVLRRVADGIDEPDFGAGITLLDRVQGRPDVPLRRRRLADDPQPSVGNVRTSSGRRDDLEILQVARRSPGLPHDRGGRSPRRSTPRPGVPSPRGGRGSTRGQVVSIRRFPAPSSRTRSASLTPCAVMSTRGVGGKASRSASDTMPNPRIRRPERTTSLWTSSPWIVTTEGSSTPSIRFRASRTPKHIPSTSATMTRKGPSLPVIRPARLGRSPVSFVPQSVGRRSRRVKCGLRGSWGLGGRIGTDQIRSRRRRGLRARLQAGQRPVMMKRWPVGRKPCSRLTASRRRRISSLRNSTTVLHEEQCRWSWEG